MSTLRILACALALLAASTVPPFATPATAGCGCDHPPPAFAPVMPPFGSPGRVIRVHAIGGSFQIGSRYTISFQSVPSSLLPTTASVVAFRRDRIEVAVPSNLQVGPVKLTVKGPRYERIYGPELFTVMPLPRKLPTGDASIHIAGLTGAVTMNGTLLVPIDLSDILDPTQFAFMLTNLPLAFGPDDVMFYNRDGVDLTLFTLAVDDSTQRQWGSYHGWEVANDGSFRSVVYDNKVVPSLRPARDSDLLTYWRHEFHTYRVAHERGGSHVVNADGFHPDGTLHVDHSMLVLAIRGMTVDPAAPQDPKRRRALAPGSKRIDLLATSAIAGGPIEPGEMARRAQSSTAYRELDGGLNDALAGLTGQTGSVPVSSGPLGLGTTTNVLLNPLTGR